MGGIPVILFKHYKNRKSISMAVSDRECNLRDTANFSLSGRKSMPDSAVDWGSCGAKPVIFFTLGSLPTN